VLLALTMVRKTIVISLLIIYAISTSGISIRQFYCCGILKSVSVVIDNFPKQGCDKGDGKSGCCKNNYQYFKLKDTHFASHELTAPVVFSSDLHIPTGNFLFEAIASQAEIIVHSSNSPPRTSTVPIYISNSVFRI
jgi:hypothetical protein